MSAPTPDFVGLSPTDIDWAERNADGTRSATLVGDRSSGYAFTYAFFVPAGFWDRPHSHRAAAHLVVASGALRLGVGATLARADTRTYRAGSFLYVPAGSLHFDGADEDTLLIGTAVGPWSTDYLSNQP